MEEKPPDRLYKYQAFSAGTLTALKARTIWFGRPSAFNDPFDCAVPLRFASVTTDECARLLGAKLDERWTQVKGHPLYVGEDGRPTDALCQVVQKQGEATIREMVAQNYLERGVTCFSEAPDDTLLWSHYGGGHRGICLEFDTSAEVLQRIHKVRYTDEIPELNIVDELIGKDSRIMWTLLTKAQCWFYEREWRAIHKQANTTYCYGVEALTGVYLGAALTGDEKDLIAHVLHGAPTKLYECGRTESSFRLVVSPVTYAPHEFDQPRPAPPTSGGTKDDGTTSGIATLN